MILLVTYTEGSTVYVSHGVNLEDDSMVVLPQIPLFYFNAKFDREYCEYTVEN